MKGNYIKPKKDHWFEGELIINSNVWYKIIDVMPDGMACAAPENEKIPHTLRLFYLCTEENEIK